MASALDTAGSILPEMGLSGSFIFGIIAWLIIAGLFIVVAAVVAYLLWRYLKYKNKIVIFEKINGKWEATQQDRAIEMKYGRSGDTLFYLRKKKKYLPIPRLQMGRRTFWYAIREDGEWINIDIEDIDTKMKTAGVNYLDQEMRHSRAALERNLRERFDKRSWIAEHWTVVAGIGFVAMIGIMTFLLFDKWIELAGTTNAGVDMARQVLEEAKTVIGALDNLKSTSGIRPAG